MPGMTQTMAGPSPQAARQQPVVSITAFHRHCGGRRQQLLCLPFPLGTETCLCLLEGKCANGGAAMQNPCGDFIYSKCRACTSEIPCGAGMWLRDGPSMHTATQTKNLTWTQSMPTLALGKLRHNCYGFQTSLDHTVRAHLKKAKFKSN